VAELSRRFGNESALTLPSEPKAHLLTMTARAITSARAWRSSTRRARAALIAARAQSWPQDVAALAETLIDSSRLGPTSEP
jgi:hypothetical protein